MIGPQLSILAAVPRTTTMRSLARRHGTSQQNWPQPRLLQLPPLEARVSVWPLAARPQHRQRNKALKIACSVYVGVGSVWCGVVSDPTCAQRKLSVLKKRKEAGAKLAKRASSTMTLAEKLKARSEKFARTRGKAIRKPRPPRTLLAYRCAHGASFTSPCVRAAFGTSQRSRRPSKALLQV